MKMFYALAAVAMLTVAASGCSWFNRGAQCNSCGPEVGGAYMAAPAVTTGVDTSTYVPGPVTGS